MPFALSIESPADEERYASALPEVRALQNDLWRMGCHVNTCGWTPNFFIASERDGILSRVKELLAAAGCSVTDERQYTSQMPSQQPHQQTLSPWNNEWTEVHKVAAEPEPLAEEVLPDVSYEQQVLAFIHELQEILMEHHLQPNDMQALLEEARHLAEGEADDGPHARLIIPLREYLGSHPEVMSA